jgi:hypothetical protein
MTSTRGLVEASFTVSVLQVKVFSSSFTI